MPANMDLSMNPGMDMDSGEGQGSAALPLSADPKSPGFPAGVQGAIWREEEATTTPMGAPVTHDAHSEISCGAIGCSESSASINPPNPSQSQAEISRSVATAINVGTSWSSISQLISRLALPSSIRGTVPLASILRI